MLLAANFVVDILYILLGMVVGAVISFFVTKGIFTKQLKENPPINEKMIEAMMSGMGRTPSQKQVNQMMKQMNKFM